MIRIARIFELPNDIRILRAEADGGGIRNMALLVDEWASGMQRFNRPGEALFAAFDGDALAGAGGVTGEPHTSVHAMRMRRLYVLQIHRRRGVGRLLAKNMIRHGFESAPLLTCNARATPAAAPFWESLGFRPVTAPNRTHELRRAEFNP